jgi:hypothetical protein
VKCQLQLPKGYPLIEFRHQFKHRFRWPHPRPLIDTCVINALSPDR